MRSFYFFSFCFFSLLINSPLFAKNCDLNLPLHHYHPKYAKHFFINYYKNFKILSVDSDQYLLSNKLEIDCETSLNKFITPVKRVAMMSTTYLPALELIHQQKTLVGFQGKNYIVSKEFNLSQIKDLAFKFNPEFLIGMHADLIMGYDSNLSTPNQRVLFKSLKIPVVINKDFLEKTPLGRAEWLIFIASFYNQDEVAIKLFNDIEKRYLAIKSKNLKIAKKVNIIVGEIQNGYWVTCGGESDLGQMIDDAGGVLEHKISSDKTQKISLEELSKGNNKFDVWLTHNLWTSKNNYLEALNKDRRYMLISAKNIYNNNLIMNDYKSNDYWETGLQRPDLLLMDLSAIFHPEEYKDFKPHWYRKL